MNKKQWETYLIKLVKPVLEDYSNGKLKDRFNSLVDDDNIDNAVVEAVSRSLMGVSTWIESEEYSERKVEMRNIVTKVLINIGNGVENFNFSDHKQKLVEAGHISYALKMAPNSMLGRLTEKQQEKLLFKISESRKITPHLNNWLLFSAMRESMFHKYDHDYDHFMIENTGLALNDWYIGDGIFKDGIYFANDYYNSLVIQPFAYELMNEEMFKRSFNHDLEKILKRYTVHQERSINSNGEYTLHGRSLAYRFGVFHHLAKMSYENIIDDSLSRSGIKNALSEVLYLSFELYNIFDKNGTLTKGITCEQSSVVESYISVGSLYMCSVIFITLGIAEEDEFWQSDDMWTSKKIIKGLEANLDKKIH